MRDVTEAPGPYGGNSLQYNQVPDHHAVHLKATRFCVSVTSQYSWKNKQIQSRYLVSLVCAICQGLDLHRMQKHIAMETETQREQSTAARGGHRQSPTVPRSITAQWCHPIGGISRVFISDIVLPL